MVTATVPQVDNRTGAVTIYALPATVNARIYAGDDFVLAVVVKNVLGESMDLAGSTARAHIRETIDAELAFEFECAVRDDTGVVLMHLPAATTAILPPSSVYDCELSQQIVWEGGPAQRVTTLIRGTITITPEITR